MQKRSVYLDCDGVLADMISACLAAHGRPEKHDDVKNYDLWNDWGMTAAQFYDAIRGYDFWFNLKPYPWAIEMFNKIRERFPTKICTASIESGECLAAKYDWLRKHFGVGIKEIVFLNDKQDAAHPLRILIDDAPKNIAAFQAAGGIALGFKQPWNKFDLTHETIHEELDQYFIP